MYTNNLTIGADPEVFVKSGGQFISGHVFVLGTKEAPQVIASGAVQNDGLAVEFNVNPARSRDEFIGNCLRVYKDLETIVKAQDPTAELSPTPTVEFGHELLRTLPQHVSELGCNPDYCAYTGEHNPAPDGNMPFRTGSGHIHIGFHSENPVGSKEHLMECCDVARQLDYFVGIASLQWDGDNRRRSLYGKAGAFRPKPYGLEYRVLSNAWLTSDALIGFVHDRAVLAMKALDDGYYYGDEDVYGEIARDIIDRNQTDWPERYPELRELAYAQ